MEDSDWEEDLVKLFQASTSVSKNNKKGRSSLDGYIGSKLNEWSTIASEKWSEESIRSNNLHLNISHDGERVKWTGDVKLLKQFVEKNLKELGEWTLREDQYKFVSPELCNTWDSDTHALQLQGNDGDRLKTTLINICNPPVDISTGDKPLKIKVSNSTSDRNCLCE